MIRAFIFVTGIMLVAGNAASTFRIARRRPDMLAQCLVVDVAALAIFLVFAWGMMP
jgi:hypothetical protein